MDYYGYPYIALTGGGDGALDSLDGSSLKDGDFAVVVVPATKLTYIYSLDADSGATEDGVTVIAPDSNAGDKRWILTSSTQTMNTVTYYGATGNGTTDDHDAIVTAAAAITTEVSFPEGNYRIESDLTLANPVSIEAGAVLIILDGVTVTLNGAVRIKGLQWVFACYGTGKVVFGDAVSEVRPEWWATNTVPGTTNMTAAIQAALTTGKEVVLSASEYLVTDTLTFLSTYRLRGQNKQPATLIQLANSGAITKITFNPTTEKDLFDITTLTDADPYVNKVYIGGIYCVGDTTGGTTTSRYGINSKAAHSTFEYLGFEQFQYGIFCSFTMLNHYRDIYLGSMSAAGILTSTDISTTDLFTNVLVRSSPVGVILQNCALFRFVGCLFETLTNHGVVIYREAGADFISCYGENVPSNNNAGAMFRIKKDGNNTHYTTNIIGGSFGGAANGASASWVDAGFLTYDAALNIFAAQAYGFTNGISANLSDTGSGSINVNGIQLTATNAIVNGWRNNNGISPIVSGSYEFSTGFQQLNVYNLKTNLVEMTDIGGMGNGRISAQSGFLNDNAATTVLTGAAQDSGLIHATINDGVARHEAGIWSVSWSNNASQVIKVSGTNNTAASDSANNLCVFASNNTVVIKNRTGAYAGFRLMTLR